MSDVPELDRLIEEADNVRRNLEWERTARFFRRTMGCIMICLFSLPVLGLLFGPIGGAIAILSIVLCLMPVLVLGVYGSLRDCFTDPPRRDPTKRYMYK